MENWIFCAVFAHLKSFDTQFRSDLNKPDLKIVFSLYDEKCTRSIKDLKVDQK